VSWRSPPTNPEAAAEALRTSPRLHRLRESLLALTFATGVVDAVSYLGLGGVFTANMTGNLVLVGFALGGAPGFSVSRTLVSLIAFMVGATLAGRLSRRWHPKPFRWMQRVTRMMLAVFTVVLIALTQLPDDTTSEPALRLAIVAALALAMGMLNATVRRLGFREIPTTVATSVISDLASESRWGGGDGRNQRDLIGAIALMLLGAMIGALLVRHVSMVAAFAVAVGAVAAPVAHQRAVALRHPGQPSAE
jgi:uncharacterized membrane protein YoaK (UPF0700 family)